MGFLLGAFGKLAAGRRVRDLQSRMMRVQSQLRRATRQTADMEKSLQRQEQRDLQALKAQGMMARNASLAGAPGADILQQLASGASLDKDVIASAQAQYNEFSAGLNANYEAYMSFAQQQISNNYEMLRETQLEPLKMEEDMLQLEKDSLESQLQIAQNDYKACQDMEKADAKNLAPSYTGQG